MLLIIHTFKEKRLSNRKIHDLTALIYVHHTFIGSKGIKMHVMENLKFIRANKSSKAVYNKQDSLGAVYKYFEKLIDFIS